MSGVGKQQLSYEILQPLTGEPPFPALFLLHGRGSNEQDLLPLGHRLDPRFLVVSPRAPFVLGPGSYHWYDLESSLVGRPSRESIEGSVELVFDLMASIEQANPTDPNRVFVGGFSMGGAMTAALTLMRPERITGALILSGYVPVLSNLPWDLKGARGKPVFEAHGVYDQVLPIQYGRMSRDFLEQSAVDLTYREYPIEHEVSPPELDDAAAWVKELLA